MEKFIGVADIRMPTFMLVHIYKIPLLLGHVNNNISIDF